MPRMYIYKLTTDNGGAPCVQDGLLSLAICKPIIRMTAQADDLIFGFAADSLYPDNRLIYIARISKKVCNGAYYTENTFVHHDDCIYQWQGGYFRGRENTKYDTQKDRLIQELGKFPDYKRANVLLSCDFRYFGSSGNAEYKSRYSMIKYVVEHLSVGHRVNHSEQLQDQLVDLKQWVWKNAIYQIMGKPSSDPPINHRGKVYYCSNSCDVCGGSMGCFGG